MRAVMTVSLLSAAFASSLVIGNAQTKVLPAVDVPASAIQERLRPRKPSELPNLRVVDGGGHNIGVGVLYRAEGDKQTAAVHYKVSEVYHVIQGSATIVTGGTLVDAKTRAAGSVEVANEDGPGASGTAIQGGVPHPLKAGDVIIIPAGTPHWFSKIDGSIAYLNLRFDPSQLIRLQ